MIPYDDLVAALSAWRASKGLPVSTMGSAGSGQHAQPGSGPTPAPMGKAPSGPKPAPPPARSKGTSVPPPLAMPDTVEEVEEAALLDESSYENEGDDFAMNFGGRARGEAPASRDSVQTDPVGAYPTKKHKPEDEW